MCPQAQTSTKSQEFTRASKGHEQQVDDENNTFTTKKRENSDFTNLKREKKKRDFNYESHKFPHLLPSTDQEITKTKS